jgi:hypothetical protein
MVALGLPPRVARHPPERLLVDAEAGTGLPDREEIDFRDG